MFAHVLLTVRALFAHVLLTPWDRMRPANDEDEFMDDFAGLLFGKLSPETMDRSWHQRLHSKYTRNPPLLVMYGYSDRLHAMAEMDKIVQFPSEMIMLYLVRSIISRNETTIPGLKSLRQSSPKQVSDGDAVVRAGAGVAVQCGRGGTLAAGCAAATRLCAVELAQVERVAGIIPGPEGNAKWL